jgi:CBS domain-containing protein
MGRAVATMRVTDLMTRPVLTLRADDTIEHAGALLSRNRITAAPVVDAEGELIGIISEGDLLRARHVPDGAPPVARATVVADAMTREVVVVRMDADLSDVAEAMLRRNVHSVPIVDGVAEVAGIVCRHDLLRAYVRTDDMVELDVQHRLDEYATGGRSWNATVRDGVVEIAGWYADEVERNVIEALARTVAGVVSVRRRVEAFNG